MKCGVDPRYGKSDLTKSIAKLNDPTHNRYQGIVDLDIEGKGTEKFHLFLRSGAGYGSTKEYFTVDTMELRYSFYSEQSGPLDFE